MVIIMHETSYFRWLCHDIGMEYKGKYYGLMLGELYKNDFRVLKSVPRDENRAKEGIRLRSDYEDETGNSCEKEGPCSILEMIIGISKRMNDLLMTYDTEYDNTKYYFWEIIRNLRLLQFDDSEFADQNYTCEVMIADICSKICNRTYDKDGFGGMFPLFGHAKVDQRKVEIWFQMHEYINWKYAIKE